MVREIEQLGHAFIFFAEQPLEQLPRPIRISRPHQRFTIGNHKCSVTFGCGKRLQQRGGTYGIAGLQVCLGIEQSDAAFLRREFIRAAKKMQRVGRGAARRSKLPGTQKCAGGQSLLADAFGRFRKTQLLRKILRIEMSDSLPAEECVLVAVCFRE